MYKFNRALRIVLSKADKLLKSTTDGDKLFHTDKTVSEKFVELRYAAVIRRQLVQITSRDIIHTT